MNTIINWSAQQLIRATGSVPVLKDGTATLQKTNAAHSLVFGNSSKRPLLIESSNAFRSETSPLIHVAALPTASTTAYENLERSEDSRAEAHYKLKTEQLTSKLNDSQSELTNVIEKMEKDSRNLLGNPSLASEYEIALSIALKKATSAYGEIKEHISSVAAGSASVQTRAALSESYDNSAGKAEAAIICCQLYNSMVESIALFDETSNLVNTLSLLEVAKKVENALSTRSNCTLAGDKLVNLHSSFVAGLQNSTQDALKRIIPGITHTASECLLALETNRSNAEESKNSLEELKDVASKIPFRAHLNSQITVLETTNNQLEQKITSILKKKEDAETALETRNKLIVSTASITVGIVAGVAFDLLGRFFRS